MVYLRFSRFNWSPLNDDTCIKIVQEENMYERATHNLAIQHI